VEKRNLNMGQTRFYPDRNDEDESGNDDEDEDEDEQNDETNEEARQSRKSNQDFAANPADEDDGSGG
jgi:hypothetical protein